MRFFLLLLLAVGGCSESTMKRTGYETLQNIRQQECYKTNGIDCENRERLEVYEDRRDAVKRGE